MFFSFLTLSPPQPVTSCFESISLALSLAVWVDGQVLDLIMWLWPWYLSRYNVRVCLLTPHVIIVCKKQPPEPYPGEACLSPALGLTQKQDQTSRWLMQAGKLNQKLWKDFQWKLKQPPYHEKILRIVALHPILSVFLSIWTFLHLLADGWQMVGSLLCKNKMLFLDVFLSSSSLPPSFT